MGSQLLRLPAQNNHHECVRRNNCLPAHPSSVPRLTTTLHDGRHKTAAPMAVRSVRNDPAYTRDQLTWCLRQSGMLPARGAEPAASAPPPRQLQEHALSLAWGPGPRPCRHSAQALRAAHAAAARHPGAGDPNSSAAAWQ